jgi:hypothetical protein
MLEKFNAPEYVPDNRPLGTVPDARLDALRRVKLVPTPEKLGAINGPVIVSPDLRTKLPEVPFITHPDAVPA